MASDLNTPVFSSSNIQNACLFVTFYSGGIMMMDGVYKTIIAGRVNTRVGRVPGREFKLPIKCMSGENKIIIIVFTRLTQKKGNVFRAYVFGYVCMSVTL